MEWKYSYGNLLKIKINHLDLITKTTNFIYNYLVYLLEEKILRNISPKVKKNYNVKRVHKDMYNYL